MLRLRDIKPEMHQSTIEIGTKPCRDIGEARTDLLDLGIDIQNALTVQISNSTVNNNGSVMAEEKGARIAAAGSHPFSSYETSKITEKERYHAILHDMGFLARDLLIFGMHVHVGIDDKDFAIDETLPGEARASPFFRSGRYFMPHVLALSTSSPFWLGVDTGLKSYRSAMFKRFPRTGLPHEFNSYAEYQRLLDGSGRGGLDREQLPQDLLPDARPHHTYPTLSSFASATCAPTSTTPCAALRCSRRWC